MRGDLKRQPDQLFFSELQWSMIIPSVKMAVNTVSSKLQTVQIDPLPTGDGVQAW